MSASDIHRCRAVRRISRVVTGHTGGSPRAIARDMLRFVSRCLAPLLLCASAARAGAQDADTTRRRRPLRRPHREEHRDHARPARIQGNRGEVAARGARHGASSRDDESARHPGVSRPARGSAVHGVPPRRVRARAARANLHRRRAVRVVPDSSGGVAAFVETTDEIPVIVGGRVQRDRPRRALPRQREHRRGQDCASRRRGSARAPIAPDTAGVWSATPLSTGRTSSSVEAYQHRIGHDAGIEHGTPVLYRSAATVVARGSALRAGTTRTSRGPRAMQLALQIDEQRWGVSALARLFGTGTVTLLGGGAHRAPCRSGLRGRDRVGHGVRRGHGRRPPRPLLAIRGDSRGGHLRGCGGVRYVQVTGFDALTGPQDVPQGVSGALFVARGLPQLGEEDFFLSGATYAGIVASGDVAGERGRGGGSARQRDAADGTVSWGARGRRSTSGRAPGRCSMVSDELSGGWRSRLPLQLTLSDRRGRDQGLPILWQWPGSGGTSAGRRCGTAAGT